MTDAEKCILSAHIQKLGHSIQEIRERALKNIISKLDNGFVYDNDLARSKEILQKLFEWFLFQQCPYEEEVLKLIKRILLTESGSVLLKHYGSKSIVSELRQTKSYIHSKHHPLLDEILELVKERCDNAVIVPPLQAEIPLSYRSCESRPAPGSSKIESTATPIEGFVYFGSSLDQQTGVINSETSVCLNEAKRKVPAIPTSLNVVDLCLPYYTLYWQPLVAPDRHVLESVEDSLRNPPELSALLHSCEFFVDVMICDFPAEVFLQRPAIVMLFQKLVLSCPSSRVTAAVIGCLLKLTNLLEIRVNYYCDPCTHNLKQIMAAQVTSNYSSPSSINLATSERTYLSSARTAYSGTSSENEKSEDAVVLKRKQMSLPHYCLSTMKCVLDYLYCKPEQLSGNVRKKSQIGINASLQLINKLIQLLSLCVTREIWEHKGHPSIEEVSNIFSEVLMKFGDVMEGLRLEAVSNDYERSYRVVHLHTLCSCIRLLNQLVPLNKTDIILPRMLKHALSSSLLDLSFSCLYPKTHGKLLKIVQEFGGHYETNSFEKYKLIKDICNSMTSSVRLIKNYKSLPTLECLKLARDSLKSLEFHKNLTVIKVFVDLCANKLPMHSFEDDVIKEIEEITLSLLSHHETTIKTDMYRSCYEKVVGAIGPKLNTSKTGAPGSQILFLIKSEIIIELALHGMSSEIVEVKDYAEDILVHILKCKILVSDDIWNCIVEALIPTLAVLLCYADKSSSLGRVIVSILDPDKAIAFNIAITQVLKGNACLLFNKDRLLREEAVSRLCWLISSENKERDMLPRLNNLHDKALSMVCQVQHSFDVNKIRTSQHFYQPSSLHQVLELLGSENIEPVIRRSALTQIAVMVEDPLLHTTFIQRRGVEIVIEIMKSSLIESSYKDYPDSIIPCVCIIKSVCLYNPGVRQELSNNLEIFHYVIRGLFLFCTEDRIKQEGSVLLFLLLYNSFIIGTPGKGDLAVPKLVAEKLLVPFSCKIHSEISKYRQEVLATSVLQDKWSLGSLQIHWNIEWFGGFKELLKWDTVHYSDSDAKEFSANLQMSNTDLCIMQKSSLEFCINKYTGSVQNATNHQSVIDSIHKLTIYINFYKSMKEDFVFECDILSLPWKETFLRFLNVHPSNDDDVELLVYVLRFLNILLTFYKYSDSDCWIINLLKDHTNPLMDILRSDASPDTDMKVLNQELLNLITSCVCYEQHYLDFHTFDNLNILGDATWSCAIETVAENLKFSDAQHFYNLAYLDCLLSCLVHLTATLGWSKSKSGQPAKPLLVQLVTGLCEMISAFHCGKGSSASASLMGLSITRHAVLSLNNLLVEMQHFNVKDWEMCFIEEESGVELTIPNLSALCSSRDVVLRAAVFQLFSGLAVSNRCATELVQELKNKDGGLWETSLIVLLDHEEASVVRENVANMLTNLCSHTVTTASDGCTLDVGVAPTNLKQINPPVNALLKLLRDMNFYKELEIVLSCYYSLGAFYFNENNFNRVCEDLYKASHADSGSLNNGEYVAPSNNTEYTARSSSSRSGSSSGDVIIVTTPGLIRALSNLLYNLMLLASDEVSTCLHEGGLIKLLFKCLSIPELKLDNTKDLGLYCDTLEMDAAICAVLSALVSNNPMCLGTVLHTRDCLNVLLTLLNPSIYYTSLPQLVYLRNRLWTEIFDLIGVLLNSNPLDNGGCIVKARAGEALGVVSAALSDCGYQPFLQSLCEAISSNTSDDLQLSALSSLTSLLKAETNVENYDISESSVKTKSFHDLLDNLRTPRTPSVDENCSENLENIAPDERTSDYKDLRKMKSKNVLQHSTGKNNFESMYIGKLYNISKVAKQPVKQVELNVRETDSLMAGAEICKILLHLLDIVSLKHNLQNTKKKFTILNTLSSILCVSKEAKRYALHNGLLELIVHQFREFNLKLSLESVEFLRRPSDKRRLNPILKETGCLVGLITNFMLGDTCVKNAASCLGLADFMHKLWVWFFTQKNLLLDVLKLLCTYTTDCASACQSLSLTSSVAGSGPRKVPSNVSLLHAVIDLISKEMDQISRMHDLTVLQLCFHLLQNSCSSTECRIILAKTDLLHCLSRLHPAITKRQKPWEHVELIWLEFLQTFTSHPEGQASVAKIPDVLELIITFTHSTKLSNRQAAMVVLQNVSFCHSNRPKLLTSADFLNTLETKLVSGSLEEKNMVVTIMWALTANNQKAKLILKCAGLDCKLRETLRILHLSSDFKVDSNDLDRMHYVLNLLKDGDKYK